jgi:hypothetical protein
VECGATQQQNHKYFQAINDQLHRGGYSALLHHLLYETDLDRFNVREAPHTDELRAQMSESLRGIEAAFYECLQTGFLPAQVMKDGTAELRTVDFIDWARKKERGWSNIKAQHATTLFDEALGLGRVQPLLKGARSRYWVIPPLGRTREIWDERRFKGSWPGDNGNWDTLAGDNVKF